MSKKLVIIQCVKRKIWCKNQNAKRYIEAEDAYIGPYFEKMKEYTEKIIKPRKWLIFSAEWGLITPCYKIQCYNTTFNKPKTNPLSKEACRERILSQKINVGSEKPEYGDVNEKNKDKIEKIIYKDFDEIIVLGGKIYIERLKKPFAELDIEIATPFQDNNLKGIGEILHWLNEQTSHAK